MGLERVIRCGEPGEMGDRGERTSEERRNEERESTRDNECSRERGYIETSVSLTVETVRERKWLEKRREERRDLIFNFLNIEDSFKGGTKRGGMDERQRLRHV